MGTPPTWGLRNLPQWLIAWGISLLLHALLLAGVAFMIERPRAVVWIDLLETTLIPLHQEEPPLQVPPPAVPPPSPRAAPAEPRPVPPTPIIASTPPEFPLRSGPPVPQQEAPSSAATTAESVPFVQPLRSAGPAATASTTSPPVAPALAETAPDRYLREQYHYIRERVMARLHYPAIARRQGWTGQVTVTFLVQPDGRVENLTVAKSSGYLSLDRQALQAVSAAAPFPDPPAAAVITLPVVFTLEPSGQ